MTPTEHKLLSDLGVALVHWLHQYAPEMCLDDDVRKTYRALMDAGGTLAYIAELRQRIKVKLNGRKAKP